jgi:hypothetical protein
MGFRMSTPAVSLIKKAAKSFKEALALLQARLPEYVRDTPEIDKEKILAEARDDSEQSTWPATSIALSKCGLEVKQDDEFWIETAASKDLETAAKRLKAA